MQQAEGEGWLRLGESVVPQCGALASACEGAEMARSVQYHQAHLGTADSLLPGLEISDTPDIGSVSPDAGSAVAATPADASLTPDTGTSMLSGATPDTGTHMLAGASPDAGSYMLPGATDGSFAVSDVSTSILPGGDSLSMTIPDVGGHMLPGADMLPGANHASTGFNINATEVMAAPQSGNMLPGADPAMASAPAGAEGLTGAQPQLSLDGPMLPGGPGGAPIGAESALAGADMGGHMLPGADAAMAPGMESLMKSVSNLLTNAISGAHPLGLLGQLFEFLFSLFSPQMLGDSVAQLAQLAESETLALMKMKQGGA